MRVVVAPASFASLGVGSVQAAQVIAEGWQSQRPDDDITVAPLWAGGQGLIDVMHHHHGGEVIPVDPMPADARPGATPVVVLMVTDPDVGPVAVLESVQACAPTAEGTGDPTTVTSAGLGRLLLQARQLGARRIVVGLGGEICHDGGAGMLAALAGLSAEQAPECYGGGLALTGMKAEALAWLPELARDWASVELVVLYDDPCPLLGFHGTSATTAVDKGATPMQAQHLERALGDFAEAAERALGRRPAPGGAPSVPGAGAGGGLGYALSLLGGDLRPAYRYLLGAVGAVEAAAAADLVVTGEAVFSWRSLRDSLITELAATAEQAAAPTVVIAAESTVGRREARAIGVHGVYALTRGPQDRCTGSVELLRALHSRAARVARTWGR